MVRTQDYYSLTLIIRSIELNPKMFIKISVKTKKHLISVNVQLNQNIIMVQTN